VQLAALAVLGAALDAAGVGTRAPHGGPDGGAAAAPLPSVRQLLPLLLVVSGVVLCVRRRAPRVVLRCGCGV
jgi:hypothetical protein